MYGIARPYNEGTMQVYEYGYFAKRRGRWKTKWVLSQNLISYLLLYNKKFGCLQLENSQAVVIKLSSGAVVLPELT